MLMRACGLVALVTSVVGCADTDSVISPIRQAPEAMFGKGPPAAKCIVGFTLTLVGTNPVRSDGLGSYIDETDNVLAFTGSGDGFRFDTEGSQRLESASDIRRVTLDFTGTGFEQHATTLKGIDFRFSGGLNLCTMPTTTSATVPAQLTFASSVNGQSARLLYGGITPGGGHDCGAQGVSPLTVTRLTQTSWQVTSGTACFYVNGSVFQGVVAMPIGFTIAAQGAVP